MKKLIVLCAVLLTVACQKATRPFPKVVPRTEHLKFCSQVKPATLHLPPNLELVSLAGGFWPDTGNSVTVNLDSGESIEAAEVYIKGPVPFFSVLVSREDASKIRKAKNVEIDLTRMNGSEISCDGDPNAPLVSEKNSQN